MFVSTVVSSFSPEPSRSEDRWKLGGKHWSGGSKDTRLAGYLPEVIGAVSNCWERDSAELTVSRTGNPRDALLGIRIITQAS